MSNQFSDIQLNVFSRVVRTAFHVSGETWWGKKINFQPFFLNLKEEFPVFWEKTLQACRCWILLHILKNFNRNLDEPGGHSTCTVEQFKEKFLGETKTPWHLGNEREVAGKIFFQSWQKFNNSTCPQKHFKENEVFHPNK